MVIWFIPRAWLLSARRYHRIITAGLITKKDAQILDKYESQIFKKIKH